MKGRAPWLGNTLLTFVLPGTTHVEGWPIDWLEIKPFSALLTFESVEQTGKQTQTVFKDTTTGGALGMTAHHLWLILNRPDRMVSDGRFWNVKREDGKTLITPCSGPWIVTKTGHQYGIRMVFQ